MNRHYRAFFRPQMCLYMFGCFSEQFLSSVNKIRDRRRSDYYILPTQNCLRIRLTTYLSNDYKKTKKLFFHCDKTRGNVMDFEPGNSINKDGSRINAIAQMQSSQEIVQYLPVDVFYKMDHSKRGLAVIFNQTCFPNLPLMDRRITNEIDHRNLSDTLKSLGFDIWDCNDYTYVNIGIKLNEIANLNHSESDCLIIVVLSYGVRDCLYACDTYYRVDLLCKFFTADKCPTLAGKPKLFFIQACQSDQRNSAFERTCRNELSDAFRIEHDFLIVYSSIPAYYALTMSNERGRISGSWFMEALSSQLRENGTRYDLLTLLTFVCKRVTKNFNGIPHLTLFQKKQVPCIISMLTSLVKFTPKQANQETIGYDDRDLFVNRKYAPF
ncbi:caspase-1-like [Nylanderia fulva]|uniref:caspase-1-like n=1 Tax=Nylanderia fulva TaxID=613905 RepID=UPI0010FBB30C|nr:caspase-1-like [Nylanderia fulva]XP_029176387.1 caspase-1-like [Nylanderia fulva]XP_029176388.1 caspase-1-like [Nylanderia fulva]